MRKPLRVVGYRKVESLSCSCCQANGKLARVRAGGDHDLVGRKHRERVCNRKQRVCVADPTLCVNPASFELLDISERPFLCSAAGDVFVFGCESSGLPADVVADFDTDARLAIPMRPGVRSLNLSNAVAVTVYEAWRQQGFALPSPR